MLFNQDEPNLYKFYKTVKTLLREISKTKIYLHGTVKHIYNYKIDSPNPIASSINARLCDADINCEYMQCKFNEQDIPR